MSTESCFNQIVEEPIRVKYFGNNGVRFLDIACGARHNLALDCNGRVWSWGSNTYGQCGVGENDMRYIWKPRIVGGLVGCKVVSIKCGHSHSFCMTEDGKCYLWGRDKLNECTLGFEVKGDDVVWMPFRIDLLIMREYKRKICGVFLGMYNTQIIIE